ncbi:hypothetical protein QCA50_019440 [Cerrena zonata]|uniref:Helitron helicase-like domain-containing protein n=1 Tax=Cerrena zonata TaxID=2478898 RepID=A0AAW0FFE8_9APHY
MPKIYSILPPPRADFDDVLAFIFIGPSPPTPEDYKRTPFLVQRNKVAKALAWLKLNHIDYADIEISQQNLDEYSETAPPVYVYYQKLAEKEDAVKMPEATAVNDNEEDEATTEGQCSFTVHGLTAERYGEWVKDNPNALRAKAVQHFKNDGHILAIGKSAEPESLYNNPQLYPQMFPWLFPYGLGGIGNKRGVKALSDAKHKKWLLMYHDKRFQMDAVFPLIAWNHLQIKKSATERMEKEGHVKSVTPEEKECFRVLNDLEFVNAKVDGSTTSRKYMRNEIWSMISSLGAPTWFITFSPADINHPIALYFADTKETFQPTIKGYNDRVLVLIKEGYMVIPLATMVLLNNKVD